MDNDANTLNGALAALQQQFGRQLAGAQDAGLGQMRQALTQQIGLDELTADRVVKKLADTGRLRFRPSGDGDDAADPPATGPILSLPGVTTSGGPGQMVVPTAPALGAASVLGGSAGEPTDAGESLGATDVAWRQTVGERQDRNGDSAAGYWQIG